MQRGLLLAAAVWLSLPAAAFAANGLRPRTPAVFEDVPCVQTIDKSTDPVFHIEYAVPYDDTDLTADELPDSRRQQFFALRKVPFDYALPVWITQADYDRAEQNGDITKMFTDEDILELSTAWPAGTWMRITPDDPRLPITMEQAAMGVDWDLADVPVGTWVIAAYTWEPENNLWSYRFGVIRLVDPSDPDSGAPAAFLQPEPSAVATAGEPYPISGCVAAEEGSTFTASWGPIDGLQEPTWVPFLEGEPAVDGELHFDVVPPDEAAGGRIKIRLEVTDPQGRTYVAFSPYPLEVLPNPSSDGDGTASEGSEDATAGGDDSVSGGCRLAPTPAPWALVALAAFVVAMGRSRSARAVTPAHARRHRAAVGRR